MQSTDPLTFEALAPSPSPLDPNFAPPTRPPSALSTTSDASFFALYDDSNSAEAGATSTAGAGQSHNAPNAPEQLPRRTVFATIRRHGQQCLLCGQSDVNELVVVRAVLQHRTADAQGQGQDLKDVNPISWLKSLKLLPQGYSRDDWTNLMTLCRPHAEAHDAGTWRWVPGASFREQAARGTEGVTDPPPNTGREEANGDVTMTDNMLDEVSSTLAKLNAEAETTTSLAAWDGYEPPPADTFVDDGISGDMKNPEIRFKPVELPSFDVLVFRPESMPPVPSVTFTEPVWSDWRTLTLNPYVAISAALPLLEATDAPAFKNVRRECTALLGMWTAEEDERMAMGGE